MTRSFHFDKMNFRGDTVATRQGREFERGKGRMAPTGKSRLLLLRLSTEDQASGARPAPGGEVAVFGVVKISCQISPRAASIE